MYIEVYREGRYVRPAGDIIRTSDARTMPILVIIKNVSGTIQPVYGKADLQDINCIFFEVTDEAYQRRIYRKKIPVDGSGTDGYKFLRPGDTRRYEVYMNDHEWEVPFREVRERSTKATVRAALRNGWKTIYSKNYEMIIDE